MSSTDTIYAALNYLHSSSLSISDLVLSILQHEAPEEENSPFIVDIQNNISPILHSMLINPYTYAETQEWVMAMAMLIYSAELIALTNNNMLCFNAWNATVVTLEEFSIQKLALKTESKAPYLWTMLNKVLNANLDLLTLGWHMGVAQVSEVQPAPIPTKPIPALRTCGFWATLWVPINLYGYFFVFLFFHGLVLFFYFLCFVFL